MNSLIVSMALLGTFGGQIPRPVITPRAQQPVAAQPAGQIPANPTAPQTAPPKAPQADSKNPIDDGGIIPQTRGPLHEAFAQTVDMNPTPSAVVPKAPPPPVPELPPGEKPAGANVQWIPGYWAWDPEKNDFLWVSGLWRNVPPDRKWLPGYWNKSGAGWQWTVGYWADPKAKPRFQDQPPDSLEQGPSQPSPNENFFYIPGAWVQQDGRYVWRPGFWYPEQQDWIYVAPHYNYTPAGAVYVDGYWDYPLADRGTMYAPVVFDQPYWNDPGWYYQPNYGLGFGFGGPFDNLFVFPRNRHFFFGDFFGNNHFRNGFHPWYAYAARNYDPLFSYYHWANRGNPGWFNGLHDNFWARVNNPSLRPATTLAQTRGAGARGGLAPGAVTPFPINTASGSGRGILQPVVARQLQMPAAVRADSERAATPAGGLITRPAGGPSMISSATAISGGSARIFNTGAATASLSRGAFASTAVNRSTVSNFAATNSNVASRGSMSYQSYYAGPSRTAPTPLYQARARQDQGFGNNSLFGGQNMLNGNMHQSPAINMGRAYMGAYGGSMSSRSGISGYSPSMSGMSRGMGPSGGMHMSGGHVGGGGGGHGGGGGGHR